MPTDTILIFPSQLGWMAVVMTGEKVKQLTFGHPTAAAARASITPGISAQAAKGGRNSALAARLQAYAKGKHDDFRDVPLDLGPVTEFQRRVLNQCRNIGYGKTISYGQLAVKAGRPHAARAVGNCMAANQIPLIIPCHRVVRSDGQLGSYSAPGGIQTKRQLLVREANN